MVKVRDTSTPVVVLRSDAHGGLNILRSLGRWGVPIYIVDPYWWAPSFASKYCRGKSHWDIEHRSSEDSLEYLSRFSRKIGRPCILIPTTDRTALFVTDHSKTLKEYFLFPHQPAEVAHSLSSKKEMYYLARRHAIPTPDAAFPRSREDVAQFARRARFPIMMKGIDGQRLWERTGKKMFIVHSEKELLEKYEAAEAPSDPNLMLQEYIPGGDDTVWMFNGYLNERSECLIGFTGKKIRQCPVYTGSTSLGICLRNETVGNTTKTFMKAIGYRGILDIGYRYDARDGQYKLLDANPRIGATFRLFVGDNGMDVARALYLDLTGQAVPSSALVPGRRWIVEDLDLVSSYRYRHDGKLTLRQWIASLRGIDEAAYLASDDLFPVAVMCAGRAAELIRRLGRGFQTKLRCVPGLSARRLRASAFQWPLVRLRRLLQGQGAHQQRDQSPPVVGFQARH